MRHHNKIQLNPFFIKMTVVLTIFICSFFLSEYQYYPTILKLICFIILILKVLDKLLINLVHKKILTESLIITVVAFIQVILSNINNAIILLLIYQIIMENQPRKNSNKRKMKIKLKKKNKIKEIYLSKVKPNDLIILNKNEVLPIKGLLLNEEAYMVCDGKETSYKTGDLILENSYSKEDGIIIKALEMYKDSDNYKHEILKENFDKAQNNQRISFIKNISLILIFIGVILIFIPNLLNGEVQPYTINIGAILILISNFKPHQDIINKKDSKLIKKLIKNNITITSFEKINNLENIENIIFEKNKVLTLGKLRVTEVNTSDKTNFWKYINYGEYLSNNTIAKALLNYKKVSIDPNLIKNYQEIESRGVECKVKDEKIIIGNAYFLKDKKIEFEKELAQGTVIYVAVNKKCIGNIVLSDSIKSSTKEVIKELKELNIKQIFAISADNERIVNAISKELGITDKYSNLTLDEKIFWTKHLKEYYQGNTLIVGSDDTNEELLKLADVSITLGNNKNADIIIEDYNLELLPEIIRIISLYKKETRRINYTFLCIKIIWIILALLNVLPIWIPLLFEYIYLKIENSN